MAVRAVPAEGHNLMTPTTSFVGRGDEVADLADRLGGGHVVTIVGPGGMGKTRLAVEVGLKVAPTWPDGVWMVDLSTVADGRMVAAGHWRDYGLSFHPEVAIFAAFRRATERPEVRIEKRPQLRLKQGAFALISEQGAILKRGHDLSGVLAPLERRLMRLVGG